MREGGRERRRRFRERKSGRKGSATYIVALLIASATFTYFLASFYSSYNASSFVDTLYKGIQSTLVDEWSKVMTSPPTEAPSLSPSPSPSSPSPSPSSLSPSPSPTSSVAHFGDSKRRSNENKKRQNQKKKKIEEQEKEEQQDEEEKKKKKAKRKEKREEKNNKGKSQNNKKTPKKKKKKDPNAWMYKDVYNHEPEWGLNKDLQYIASMHTPNKIPIKKDRKVVFTNITVSSLRHERDPDDAPTYVRNSPRELLKANAVLRTHPLHLPSPEDLERGKPFYNHTGLLLPDVMTYLKNTRFCSDKPIFIGMATVGDDLYWQLIENFFYTAVKFNISQCSMLICVSDLRCMEMCRAANFPCYLYQEARTPLPSVMEQIAVVKLHHVPKALTRGIDLFMLDLDVGFLADPHHMLTAFRETPLVDVLVQEDYIFVMNRSKVGWKTWHTEPLPNIGMLMLRGNNRTRKVFDIAWQKYLKMPTVNKWGINEKESPGKDQNHVLDAMRIGRGTFGLKYAYFDNHTAPLLDKMARFHGTAVELGGHRTAFLLEKERSIAVHTTCYEKSTKVMGLKAANAFWNPRYYDQLAPTLTKQLLYVNELQVLDEVRSLVYLAVSTGRNLMLPNLLGHEQVHTLDQYKNHSLWPGFRITFLKRWKGRNVVNITILEPSFYWRIERDYDPAPRPYIVRFVGEYAGDREGLGALGSTGYEEGAEERRDRRGIVKRGDNGRKQQKSLQLIKRTLLTEAIAQPRVILHYDTDLDVVVGEDGQRKGESLSEEQQEEHRKRWQQEDADLLSWANDSVGVFRLPYSQMVMSYRKLPSVKSLIKEVKGKWTDEAINDHALAKSIMKGLRNCMRIFAPPKGNRTCFQICD